MRGIISAAGYVPYWRLQRSAISEALGSNAGKGTRSVASFDEDSTTMAVEAARIALRSASATPASGIQIDTLWFATTSPTYAEKTSATIVHAALRLDGDVLAADAASSLRGTSAALRSAFRSTEAGVVVAAGDIRTGMAGSPDERSGGDAGAAVVVGEGSEAAPVIAELVGTASVTREFLDRWRAPGALRTHSWEDRFGEQRYAALAGESFDAALKDAGIEADQLSTVAISTPRARSAAGLSKKLGAAGVRVTDDLGAAVGFSGAAHPALMLADMLDTAEAGQLVALIVMADGVDTFILRVTDAIDRYRSAGGYRSVAEQIAAGNDSLPYAKYLSWRGVMPLQPPNRPEPARMSASAAQRRLDWKYGFVGSRDRESHALHLPPARVSFVGGNVDDMDPAPMADVPATVATFTVDSLAYSPSPPIVFAVCDFEGGGRLPIELTDVTADQVSIGMTVEMTFRRLNTADDIANYFWKARPRRGASNDAANDNTGGSDNEQGS